MNAKNKKTLALIFETPTRADISWTAAVSLIVSIGASMKAGRGSRVRFKYQGHSLHIHAPHPGKVASKSTVESIRDFLTITGVRP
jgi:hypothetical protein